MSDRLATMRILDANANRAVEGLRVVEEYLRFVLEDRALTTCCKQLRHDLATLLTSLPDQERLAARDTLGDVGTTVAAGDEYHRGSLHDVWQANHRRVEQSLRCLEEYSKPLGGHHAAEFEQLRYRLYTLVKASGLLAQSTARLADARLYVLLDGGANPAAFQTLVEQLVAAKVDVLQLRDKQLSDRELIARARQLRALTRHTSTRFIMNDRPDLAVLAEADGVHVGQDELTVADARAIVGPHRLVGVSTHCLAEVDRALLEGADYIGCGPTFPSQTKSFSQFPGLEFLKAVAHHTTLPAFAIGGITEQNLGEVLATGFTRVAVGACVTQSSAPGAAAGKLQSLLAQPRS